MERGHQGTSRTAPHSFANRLVVAHMSRALLGTEGPPDGDALVAVPAVRINDAAFALLTANTAALEAKGAETVTRLFTADAASQ